MRYTGWSYAGLTFGEGTNFSVIETTGFDDLPPIRPHDVPKAAGHGAFAGIDLLGERTCDIKFALVGQDRPSYDALVQQMIAAFTVQPTELPLYCGDGGNRVLFCRPRKVAMPRKRDYHGTFNDAANVEVVATDPRIYSAALVSLTTGLAASSGGVAFNVTFPAAFGSVTGGGTLAVNNAGNTPTDATMTIAGPVTNPIVDNLTTGVALLLGITLAATDTLVLDTAARTVTLNGTASRAAALQSGSTWWSFPGGQTMVRYRNNGGYNSTSQLTVAYRHAWLALASGGA